MAPHDKVLNSLRNFGPKANKTLKIISDKARKERRIPKNWMIGVLMPLHKKKYKDANYRGFILFSIVGKAYGIYQLFDMG